MEDGSRGSHRLRKEVQLRIFWKEECPGTFEVFGRGVWGEQREKGEGIVFRNVKDLLRWWGWDLPQF